MICSQILTIHSHSLAAQFALAVVNCCWLKVAAARAKTSIYIKKPVSSIYNFFAYPLLQLSFNSKILISRPKKGDKILKTTKCTFGKFELYSRKKRFFEILSFHFQS